MTGMRKHGYIGALVPLTLALDDQDLLAWAMRGSRVSSREKRRQ